MFPTATDRRPPSRYRGRPGRQPLVYRECRNKIGQITRGRRRHGVPRPLDQQQSLGNIVAGPDGNLWFTETSRSTHKIGRITTAGVVTEFSIPTGATSGPGGIAAGPDGNLWFTYAVHTPGTSSVTRMSGGSPRPASSPVASRSQRAGFASSGRSRPARTATSGSPSTPARPDRADHRGRRRHRVPAPDAPAATRHGSRPGRTATSGSPRGTGNQIGRITPAGVVTEFPIPTAGSGPSASRPARTATSGSPRAAPTRSAGSRTAGVVTEFPIPRGQHDAYGHRGRPGRQPLVHRVDPAPTRSGESRTAGVVTEFPIPTADSDPRASRPARTATSGSPKSDGNKIGRITTAGVITEFSDPHGRQRPYRHHGRPGRQPLVHRIRAPTRSGGSPRPASSPSSRSPRPTALRSSITAGPDGNLWFTEVRRQPDRPDHDGRRHHRVPDPHGRQPSRRHRGRPGRQPLVHRSRPRNKIGRITHGRRRHRVPDPHGRQRPRRHHGRPGRQPLVHRVRRQPDRADHHGRRRHRVPDPHGRQPPVGIAAGPDGNLWFTESNANQIGRITTGAHHAAADGCRCRSRHRERLQRQRRARAGRDRPGRSLLEEHPDRLADFHRNRLQPRRSPGPTYTIDDAPRTTARSTPARPADCTARPATAT